MHPDSLLFPRNQVSTQRRIAIVSAAIGFTGVLLFKWQVSQVIYLFLWDFFLMGVSTILRILFALGGRDKIVGRIIWSIGFAVLYMGLFALLLSFLMVNMNMEEFGDYLGQVHVAVWALAANHLYGFLFGYLKNGVNKSATTFGQMFSTMFYVLPMTAFLIIFVFPNSLSFGESNQNTYIATVIVNLRFALDMIFSYIQKKRHLYY